MPIFDQGYQHWKGPLAGHGRRWLAIARQGVRAQLKSRIVRLLLLAAWMPALGLIGVLALWGLLEQQAETVLNLVSRLLPDVAKDPGAYRTAVWTIAYSFFFKAELVCSLFLVLMVGPNLISRDLRFNALPLYFSRPLRRIDYFLGKLGVIGFYLLATVIGPAIAAYILGVAFSLDLSVIADTHRLLWASLVYGLVIAVSAGTLVLALSSLSRRSIYVGIAWAGFCFLTLLVSSILVGVSGDIQRREAMQGEMEKWLKDHPPPPGVEVFHHGAYTSVRYRPRAAPDDASDPNRRDDEARRYQEDFWRAHSQAWVDAEAARLEAGRDDWRPIISYPHNLDRLGDQLLGTDHAWMVIGRALERPVAAIGPVVNLQTRGSFGPRFNRPPNDRRYANRWVGQFPWQWSVGVLAGLLLVSVWILNTRVKSLDRLS